MASPSHRNQLGALAARGPATRVRARQDTVEQWLQFAASQHARAAPHPSPAGAPAATGTSTPFRLHLAHLEGLPLFQAEARNLEVRAGVTLFDAAAGAFFGNTVYTPPVQYDMRKSKGRKGFHVDLSADVMFHSSLVGELLSSSGSSSGGSGCDVHAVVEVVLVERSEEGVVESEFSAGWAQLPLQLLHGQSYASLPPRGSGSAPSSPVRSPTRRADGASAGALFAAGSGVQLAAVQEGSAICSVPVLMGSPRYLLLKKLFPEQALPPLPLTADGAQCRLHYLFEVCPEMEAWQPLLPSDFLVCHHDAIPGVQRLDAATGLPTLRFLGAASMLLQPRLCSVHALALRRLQLALPAGFLEVVRRTLLLGGGGSAAGVPGSPGPSAHGGYIGSPGRLALPQRELQQRLRLRVSVHNGRTFVGPAVWARPASLETMEGHTGEHCLTVGGDVAVAWVPGDLMVALVLELVLVTTGGAGSSLDGEPGSGSSSSSSSQGTILAWGAAVPFKHISGGGAAAPAEGEMQVAMKGGPGHWVRQVAVLDWRRLLERTNRVSLEPPIARFDLRHAAGQGIWPPPSAPVSLSLSLTPSTRQQAESTQPSQLPNKQPSVSALSRHLSRNTSIQPLSAPAVAEASQAAPLPVDEPSRNLVSQRTPSAVSEAETVHTFREGASSRQAAEQKGKAAQQKQAGRSAGYKALARAETVQAWQINAHYDGLPVLLPVGSSSGSEERLPLPAVPPIKTRAQQRSKGDELALFTGSPTAQYARAFVAPSAWQAQAAEGSSSTGDWWYPGSKGRPSVRWGDVAALAATATPISHSLARRVDLAAEVAGDVAASELTVQFVGYAPGHGVTMEQLGGRGRDAVLAPPADGGPGCLHFTFRLFDQPPTITAAVQPRLLPAASSGRRLCALMPAASDAAAAGAVGMAGGRSSGSAGNGGDCSGAAGVAVTLNMASAEQQLLQQLGQLSEEHGLRQEECRSSVVQQLRLRAARYLAEQWLHVDCWDSTSLLQVGSFSVPLRGLLRQGQQVAEVVHECPILDPAEAVQRESSETAAAPASAALRGSILVRLMNRAVSSRPGEPGEAAAQGERAAPAPAISVSPSRQQPAAGGGAGAAAGAGAEVVVRARPALDEPGEIAVDLASREGVAPCPKTLKQEIIHRAQQKVQRILHYRHVSTPSASAPTRAGGCGGLPEGEAAEDVGRLVHDHLLADIEQARARAKPDLILRKLQQELPASMVLCAGAGEAVGFEREFANPSHEEGVFEVSTSAAAGELALVSDTQEWQALAEAAGHAGLLCTAGSAGPRHVITSSRFALGPRQRAVLRFVWRGQPTAAQQEGQCEDAVRAVQVSITRANSGALGGLSPDLQEQQQMHSYQQLRGSTPQRPQSPNLRFPQGSPHSSSQAQQQQQQQQRGAGQGVAPGALASFKVLILQQPPLVARTLRLYHPAGPGQAGTAGAAAGDPSATYRVLLSKLPGAEAVARGNLRVPCSAGMGAAVVGGAAPNQPPSMLLSFPAPPPAGSSLRCQLAAFGGGSGGVGMGSAELLEVWEVFLHVLPCLELRAVVGETVSIEKRVEAPAGGGSEGMQQLSCHWLCRDELQVSPAELDLQPGTQGRLQLSYTPLAPSKREALLVVVDDVRQRPVEMLVVRLDSTATRISRTFEVSVERGKSVSKKVTYTNPYAAPKALALRTTQPGLLRFARPELEVPAGGTAQLRMTFDASSAARGTTDLLVFVDDVAEKRVEECFKVRLSVN